MNAFHSTYLFFYSYYFGDDGWGGDFLDLRSFKMETITLNTVSHISNLIIRRFFSYLKKMSRFRLKVNKNL